MNLNKLKNKIKEANRLYRLGNPIITDQEYDQLIDQLRVISPNDELLQDTGTPEVIDKDRKVEIPILIHSFNKVYEEELDEFLNKYERLGCGFVASIKYDGAALILHYKNGELFEAYTKGHKNIGQRSYRHAYTLGVPLTIKSYQETFVKCEVVMRKDIFSQKYSSQYKNSRNMIAGLLNRKEKFKELKDCDYKAHSISIKDRPYLSKLKQFDLLKFHEFDVVEHFYGAHFPHNIKDWEYRLREIKNGPYLADGIVVEVAEDKCDEKFGYDPSGNPKFGVAYKVQFEENMAISTVTEIEWNLSKNGVLVPRVTYEPVELNETTCTHASGFNYKFIVDNQIGIGTKIKLQKSGDIIPYIIEAVEDKALSCSHIPEYCPSCRKPTKQIGVNLICDNPDCGDTVFKNTLSFFKILGVENFGKELIGAVLEENNIDSYQDIILLPYESFLMPGIGEKSATKIYNSIRDKLNYACKHPEILMHASGYFPGLGSKKLGYLIEEYGIRAVTENLKYSEITSVEGFSDKSADIYKDGINNFVDWTIKSGLIGMISIERKQTKMGKFSNQVFIFTGFRDKDLQKEIEDNGGQVVDSFNKTVTTVITKDINSTSSKIQKAKSLGIKVISRDEFKI